MTMDPKILSIHEVFGGGRRYVIPAYQRPYSWEDEHVEQLINDINDSFNGAGKDGYFVGSLICIEGDNGEFEVVDGQQRLITFTLIFYQLAEYLSKEKDRLKLKECYLKEDFLGAEEDATPVVKARVSEQDVYGKVLAGDSSIETSDLSKFERVFMDNVKSIKKYLDKILGDESGRESKAKQFAKHMAEKVNVIFLAVDDRSSSFRLFNVLNNRGTPLSDADLLKNNQLEAVQGNAVNTKKVEDAWRKIEECTEETDVNTFLTINKISEKKDRDRAVKQNYQYYIDRLKNHYKSKSATMTADLLQSARHYQKLVEGQKDAPQILNHLLHLDTGKEWLPAFLAFFNKCDKRVYKKGDFPRLAVLFEKVYMHHFLANSPASQRQNPCYHAIEAMNNDKKIDEVMAVIKGQVPDKKLEDALDNSHFYDASRHKMVNLMKCILLRIENERHDDSAAVPYDLGVITVEHVMPQNLENEYWRNRFSPDEHKEWLHRIGNLTLLPRSKNSAARDFGFDKKKAAYEKAKKKTPFEITKEICLEDEWNMEALKKRHENLKREIIDIWGIDSSSD